MRVYISTLITKSNRDSKLWRHTSLGRGFGSFVCEILLRHIVVLGQERVWREKTKGTWNK